MIIKKKYNIKYLLKGKRIERKKRNKFKYIYKITKFRQLLKLFNIIFLACILLFIKSKEKGHLPDNILKGENKYTNDTIDYKDDEIEPISNNSYLYFSCFVGMGKKENRYARELIEHYISIGVDKLILGDNNDIGDEKLSEVMHDYIDKRLVDIVDLRGKSTFIMDYFSFVFKRYKYKCQWLIFFDFDEFLEFKDKDMNIKTYLSMDIFNKCDTVRVHWLMYSDNDLVYYDNRTLKERFNKSVYGVFDNNFHKSIVRSKKYNGDIWAREGGSIHQPNTTLTVSCDAVGNIIHRPPNILGHPNYKYCYIRHHSMKTIEEYGFKIKRGIEGGGKYNANEKLNEFFRLNKFTKEKLSVIEKMFNTTFIQFQNNNSSK